jgi:hypothetical protein
VRSLSSTARRAVYAANTGEVFVFLLTLRHPSFAADILVCSDSARVVSLGRTFEPFPFQVSLADETEDAPARVALTIGNVDRRIVEEIRRVPSGAVEVVVELVLASSPQTREAGPLTFTLRDVQYDALQVDGELAFEDLLNEPWPAHTMTPGRFPGMFAG